MKRLLTFSWHSTIISCIILTLFALVEVYATPFSVDLRGTVKDKSGKGVSGAIVGLVLRDSLYTKTNANGEWTINGVTPITNPLLTLKNFAIALKGPTLSLETVKNGSQVSVELYSLLGKKIFSLNKNEPVAGTHAYVLPLNQVATSVYILRIGIDAWSTQAKISSLHQGHRHIVSKGFSNTVATAYANGAAEIDKIKVEKTGYKLAKKAIESLSGNHDIVLEQDTHLELYEPPDGKTLVIIGQNTKPMMDYVAASKKVPAGFMTYSQINTMKGFDVTFTTPHPDSIQEPESRYDFHHWLAEFDDIVIQDGLWLCGEVRPYNEDLLISTIAGEHDDLIKKRAHYYKESNVPVMLRVGYEIEGRFHYRRYAEAYQHIYKLTKAIAPNVAFVWHVTYNRPNRDFGIDESLYDFVHGLWWPGDEYVDWVAISYFDHLDRTHDQYGQPIDSNAVNDQKNLYLKNTKKIINFAREKDKPVMLAECAQMITMDTPLGKTCWDMWFRPFFDLVEEYDIEAISYINQNWQRYQWDYFWKDEQYVIDIDFSKIYAGTWTSPYTYQDASPTKIFPVWGDTRVDANDYVFNAWMKETAKRRYVHSSKDLFPMINFKPDPTIIEIDYSQYTFSETATAGSETVTYGYEELNKLLVRMFVKASSPNTKAIIDPTGSYMTYVPERGRLEHLITVDPKTTYEYSFRIMPNGGAQVIIPGGGQSYSFEKH